MLIRSDDIRTLHHIQNMISNIASGIIVAIKKNNNIKFNYGFK